MAKATLTISSKNYSSWSLRGWLLTRFSGIPFDEIVVAPDDPSARYFALHSERDVEHAAEARAALEAEAPADTMALALAVAAERALEANWKLLDGVDGRSG